MYVRRRAGGERNACSKREKGGRVVVVVVVGGGGGMRLVGEEVQEALCGSALWPMTACHTGTSTAPESAPFGGAGLDLPF